jgi:diacylglycerol O-acyltransferase-1
MDAAISSGVEATARVVHRATPKPPPPAEGHTDTNDSSNDTRELKKALLRKYRHTVAVHSKVRPSTLSHDASQTPSFIGFRNLGLIVLSKLVSR